MSYYSTNDPALKVSLEEAVLSGLASDGGLYMPLQINRMDPAFLGRLPQLSFQEMAFEIAHHFLQKEIPKADLKAIVEKSISFDAPLIQLSENIFSLELFHGPTLSFKDFGARFMAGLMGYFLRNQKEELHILVATSGDTGSAVANGFLNVPGIRVWILYPKGQVSHIQEQQLTTMGDNVAALEIEGTFDDCQGLVKQAFKDAELSQRMRLTSANSINIARLIPQSFYYFSAYAQLKTAEPLIISVPSGNFGNLTAGLFAKKMGLPIERFVAATNSNDSVPRYLQTGLFESHPSKKTISNAMDVGNPSNFARMRELYPDLEKMRRDIYGVSFSDLQTEEGIKEIYQKYHYIADPHGAIAYLGLADYFKDRKGLGVFLETAHPAKFLEVIEPLIRTEVNIPEQLVVALSKKKSAKGLSNQYQAFKESLLNS